MVNSNQPTTANTTPRKWKPGEFALYRREVASIQKATAAGTRDFEAHAHRIGAEIKTCLYSDIIPWCDTLAFLKDSKRLIVTEQNLQYFPWKIRYYESKTNNSE